MSFVTNRVNTLNRNYKRGIEISFIIVLLLIIAAFKFAPMKAKPQQVRQPDQDVINIKNIEPSVQLPKPPPPPKPPVIIEASLDDEIEDIILPPTDIFDNDNVPDIPETPEPPVIKDENVIFKELESPPVPVGGLRAISERIHYTEIARRAGIEGTVLIEIIINKAGIVEEAKVLKSLNPGLDEIALQAVRDTKFIPGKQRDKPVKVKMRIPIKFRLQ
jgi:protein TonB